MVGVALAARFLAELTALAALAYGGWRLPVATPVRVLAAVALPVAAAAAWGRWVAPRGAHRLPDPARLLPEWLVFGGGTVALLVTGRPLLAAVLVVVAAGSRLALWRLGADTDGSPPKPVDPHR